MHFHAPLHPFHRHAWSPFLDGLNLLLILLGLLLAVLVGPLHLD